VRQKECILALSNRNKAPLLPKPNQEVTEVSYSVFMLLSKRSSELEKKPKKNIICWS